MGLVLVAIALTIASGIGSQIPEQFSELVGVDGPVWRVTLAAAIATGAYGLYLLANRAIVRSVASKPRAHRALNILRLGLGLAATIAILALVTQQWVGLLFSLGVVGFAITIALQQPLFSLIGWLYIMLKQPYQVGDRVRIEDAKGDVIDIDFLVTTLWEINGELVSSNQPSGRLVTLPNSTVLSSQIYNYSWTEFPFVWNEISIQVAYESDLEFTRQLLADVADEYLGDEMERNIERYREVLSDTPVELEVRDRPSVNVVQRETFVELQVRYLVDPKEGQRTKNELYTRALDRFNEHPEQVAFPATRSR